MEIESSALDDGVLKDENQNRVTSAEKLEDRDWSRDNIEDRIDDVRTIMDTIETILQDINQEIASLPTHEELEDEWESYLDRKPEDEQGRPKEYPRPFIEVKNRKIELLMRQALWQARLKEVEKLARSKIYTKFEELLEEYRTAKSYETIQDAMDDKAEQFAESKINDKVSKVESYVNTLEQLLQAVREERKSDRETIKRLASAVDGVDEDEVTEAVQEGLERFVTDRGLVSLDPGELELSEKRSDREQGVEGSKSSVVEEVKSGEDSEEEDTPVASDDLTAREEIVKHWDDYYALKDSQKDIAEEVGVKQSRVSQIVNEENLDWESD